jgi:acetyl esterase
MKGAGFFGCSRFLCVWKRSGKMMRVLRFLVYALLGLFGLTTIGLFLPAIPVLGELGPVLTTTFGLWIVLIVLIGAVWAYWRWRTNGKRRALVVTVLAGVAALAMGYAQYSQIRTATIHGAQINLASAFLAGTQMDDSLKVETVIYAKHDGQNLPLDIYRPKPRTDGKPAPIFVYVHGGGWGGQTLKQRQADYRWFAERGYLVISLEYSLSTEKRHTWNIATPQLGCALAWVNANAARYGGDASRFALWGESAGGNLVLNLSYMASAGTLKPSCAGTVPKIDAAVALYPVVDPARMYRPEDPMLGVFGRMMGDNYTGGSPEQYPERYKAIASVTHISAKAPPTLLIIPEADHLVAPDAAYAFAAKAKAAGIKTRLIKMPYAEHAFDLRSGGIGNQMVRQTMLRFLVDQGLKP